MVIRKLWRWIIYRIELIEMDNLWYLMGGGCFGQFPPSFYYTHTKEEVERIRAEELKELEDYLAEYRARIGCGDG